MTLHQVEGEVFCQVIEGKNLRALREPVSLFRPTLQVFAALLLLTSSCAFRRSKEEEDPVEDLPDCARTTLKNSPPSNTIEPGNSSSFRPIVLSTIHGNGRA